MNRSYKTVTTPARQTRNVSQGGVHFEIFAYRFLDIFFSCLLACMHCTLPSFVTTFECLALLYYYQSYAAPQVQQPTVQVQPVKVETVTPAKPAPVPNVVVAPSVVQPMITEENVKIVKFQAKNKGKAGGAMANHVCKLTFGFFFHCSQRQGQTSTG